MDKITRVRRKIVGFAVCFIILTVSGCQMGSKPEEVTLTFNFPSADLFYKRMGYAFELQYPNIHIEIIEPTDNETSDFSTDIIHMYNIQSYRTLIEQNKLASISSFLKRDKKELAGLSPMVMELLISEDDALTYGLPQWFDSEALFFNKGMFEQHGVTLPTNGMTWAEVYKLAEQFPNVDENNKRIYGYAANYDKDILINLILRAGRTEGRTFIDPQTLQLSINTEEWRRIGESVLHAVKKGVIPEQAGHELGEKGLPPVVTGQAAMELGSINRAFDFQKLDKLNEHEPVDWGVVTIPIDPRNPDYSDSYKLNQLLGIHKGTKHPEEAWQFIKFVSANKPYYAANLEELQQFGLPILTELTPFIDSHDLSPFYSLKALRSSNNPYDIVQYDVINAFKEAAQPLLDEVVKENITIEEAFSRIEREGQAAVDAASQRTT